MKAIAGFAAVIFGVLLSGAFGLILLVVVASSGAGSAAIAVTVSNPSEEAMEGIPAPVSYTHLRAHETVLSRMPSSA